MFNAAFFSSPVLTKEDLRGRLEDARAYFTASKLPWALWVCEDYIAAGLRRGLGQTCQRFSLRLSSEMPGMTAPGLASPDGPYRNSSSNASIQRRRFSISEASARSASTCPRSGFKRFSTMNYTRLILASSVGWAGTGPPGLYRCDGYLRRSHRHL